MYTPDNEYEELATDLEKRVRETEGENITITKGEAARIDEYLYTLSRIMKMLAPRKESGRVQFSQEYTEQALNGFTYQRINR